MDKYSDKDIKEMADFVLRMGFSEEFLCGTLYRHCNTCFVATQIENYNPKTTVKPEFIHARNCLYNKVKNIQK